MHASNTQPNGSTLPEGITKLLLLGGAAYLGYRLLAGIGTFLWTAIGMAIMFWFVGGFDRFF